MWIIESYDSSETTYWTDFEQLTPKQFPQNPCYKKIKLNLFYSALGIAAHYNNMLEGNSIVYDAYNTYTNQHIERTFYNMILQ